MKRLLILFAVVAFSHSAEARKVCGIEVGKTPTHIMSQACNPMTEQKFISMLNSPGHSYKKCVINGKSIIVGIAPLFFAIFDFTTSSDFRICQGNKIYR